MVGLREETSTMRSVTWTDPKSALRHIDTGHNSGPTSPADTVNKALLEHFHFLRLFTADVTTSFSVSGLSALKNLSAVSPAEAFRVRQADTTHAAFKKKTPIVGPSCYWQHRLFVCRGPTTVGVDKKGMPILFWYLNRYLSVWLRQALTANYPNTCAIENGRRILGRPARKTWCVRAGSWFVKANPNSFLLCQDNVNHHRGAHRLLGIVQLWGTGHCAHSVVWFYWLGDTRPQEC